MEPKTRRIERISDIMSERFNMITPESLFKYVEGYTRRALKTDKREVFPTFREVAKRFRCKYDDIEATVEDYCGDGYMGVAIGIQVNGAIGLYESRGQYYVEAYK
jgi:hypothetical protein